MTRFVWIAAALSLSTAAMAQPPEDGQHVRRGPPPVAMIAQHRGEELGIPSETVDALKVVGEAARADTEELREEMKKMREQMRALFGAEVVDEKAIRKQSDAIDRVADELHLMRLEVELQSRALVTAEQWAALTTPPADGQRPIRRDRKGL